MEDYFAIDKSAYNFSKEDWINLQEKLDNALVFGIPHKSRGSPKDTQKQKIKKIIRDSITNNSLLERVLNKHHVKGDFIKEATNYALRNEISEENLKKRFNYNPINECLYWENTNKGRKFWSSLEEEYMSYL